MQPTLYIVIPCYNEQEVLPRTAPLFLEKIDSLIEKGKIGEKSRILFVNDGSRDDTWKTIENLSYENEKFEGISLSRNQGHQNALLAGLTYAVERSDIFLTLSYVFSSFVDDGFDAVLNESQGRK